MQLFQSLFNSGLLLHESNVAKVPTAGEVVEIIPKNKTLLPYLLYLPQDYQSNKKAPMLLFLHGVGERGNNLNTMYTTGLPALIKSGKHFPFIIVMPQCPNDGDCKNKASKQFWWKAQPILKVKNILDAEINQRAVDTSRIYVTGLSMGGMGTYNIINRFPNYFAAAAPICGYGVMSIDTVRLSALPIWAFHGDKDEVVPLVKHQKTVDMLKQAGSDVQLTVYKGVGHDSWSRTYQNIQLYTWLLSHQKKSD